VEQGHHHSPRKKGTRLLPKEDRQKGIDLICDGKRSFDFTRKSFAKEEKALHQFARMGHGKALTEKGEGELGGGGRRPAFLERSEKR